MQPPEPVLASTSHLTQLDKLQQQLSNHPIYAAIDSTQQLKIFMQQHVFAVWDFMSLIKSAQSLIAPTTIPWTPSEHPRYVHYINQLVTEEESDIEYSDHAADHPCSHFERYINAMTEIGAETSIITSFVDSVRRNNLDIALNTPGINLSTRKFIKFTFDVIKQNQPHLTVAVLALGREDLVPHLFRPLQHRSQLSKQDAPQFFHYLERHIQLDEQEHGPIALKLLNELCNDSTEKYSQAMAIAQQALKIRLNFWDEIYYSLNPNQQAQSYQ